MIQTLFGSLEEPEKKSIFGRMKEAVSRTRETLADRIEGIVALTHEVDEAALEELELSLVAIARELKVPVRYVGVGEKLDDLLPFDSKAFVDSLLDN